MYFRSVLISILIAVALTAPAKDKAKKDCKSKPADFFFLLDSSSSIWSIDFGKQLQFVNDVIENFDISATESRVGVASFSNRYHENIKLDTFDNKESLMDAVQNIRQVYGNTYTYDALDGVRTRGLSPAIVRPDVPRIAIVLTDGESYNSKKTIEAAKKLKDEGVVVFAIGIGGNTNRKELEAIASVPTDKFLFEVDNYGLLDTIKNTFSVKACEVEFQNAQPSEPTCGAINAADVMFLVDPAEVGPAHASHIYEFIGHVTEDFNMLEGNIQVGVESRNCGADNIQLGQYEDKMDLIKAFRNTKLPGMSHMIKRLRTHAYNEENGGRTRARHMAVVFVDDKLHNAKEVLNEARRTKNYDVELFVVAIGDSVVEDELMTLCSNPVDRHFIRVPSYKELMGTKQTFLDQFCHGL